MHAAAEAPGFISNLTDRERSSRYVCSWSDSVGGTPMATQKTSAAQCPPALAASKPQQFAELVLAGKQLAGLFGVVVGSDREGGRLTKGDVIASALVALGTPTFPVMVGDRRHDVLGAAEHRVPSIGVLWGYGEPGELEQAGAAALAATPVELVDLLT